MNTYNLTDVEMDVFGCRPMYCTICFAYPIVTVLYKQSEFFDASISPSNSIITLFHITLFLV